MDVSVSLKNVAVDVKKSTLLHDVSFDLHPGDIVQLIGENGSGKSTLLRVIAGLLTPKTGEVTVNGQLLTPGTYAPKTAALINAPVFLPNLSAFSNLSLLAKIKKQISADDIKHWMKQLELDPEDSTPVKKFSLGMNQKLGLIQALMEKEDVILLDEPLNGLDLKSKKLVLQLLETLQQEKPATTFVIVSHDKFFQDFATRFLYIDGDTITERGSFDDQLL